jgi:predicted ABC-type ATPase
MPCLRLAGSIGGICNMPTLYIIAGPNGAGKTTASYTLLPEVLHCDEFVNADDIAKGLSPFNAESVAIEAGRIMLSRIKYLLAENKTFAFETTLATRSYVGLIKEAREKGYEIELVFFWLNRVETCIERVKTRVLEGGHNIPEDTIRRRYERGINNFVNLYEPLVDKWMLFDTTHSVYEQIAAKGTSGMVIQDDLKYNLIFYGTHER